MEQLGFEHHPALYLVALWARLPFRLNVSNKIFQRRLNEALSDLEGIFTIADDIIIVGCDDDETTAQKDNDDKLAKLYKRCEERHIALNEERRIWALKLLSIDTDSRHKV